MNPSVPRFLLAALLCVPAGASANFDEPSKNWKSLEFDDVNGRPQKLWLPTEGSWVGIGEAIDKDPEKKGLYELKPLAQDNASFSSLHSRCHWYPAVRVPGALTTGAVGCGGLDYKAPVKVVGAAQTPMTVRPPKGTAEAVLTPFMELTGPVSWKNPIEAVSNPHEKAVAALFTPLDTIFADGNTFPGLTLAPIPADVRDALRLHKTETVDAFIGEKRRQIAPKVKALKESIEANKAPETFIKGEDVLLLKYVQAAAKAEPAIKQAYDAELKAALDGKDVKPFVAKWRAILLDHMKGYVDSVDSGKPLKKDLKLPSVAAAAAAPNTPANKGNVSSGAVSTRPLAPARVDTSKVQPPAKAPPPQTPAQRDSVAPTPPPPVQTEARPAKITRPLSKQDCEELKKARPSITCEGN